MDILIKILTAFGLFLMEAAPFMLLGLFFAGLLKAFLPDNIVQKHIGSNKKGGIFKASAFGVPIPLCSCGVVPAAAGIRRQGAGKGSVVSFLVSTPETGIDSIAITYAMLGPVMAVIRPVAAFITALFTGTLVEFFDKSENSTPDLENISAGCSDSCCSSEHNHTSLPMAEGCGCGCSSTVSHKDSNLTKFKKGMNFAFLELVGDIAAWFIIGVLFAAVIAVFITPEAVNSISAKNSLLIMGLMLLISVPLYVCATSSTPIAAAFLLTGVSPGAALVFLLAGPATNAASLSVISRIIGKKATFIYLAGIIFCSLAAGLAADWLFAFTGYKIAAVGGEIKEGAGLFIELGSAIILSFFLLIPFYNKVLNYMRKNRS